MIQAQERLGLITDMRAAYGTSSASDQRLHLRELERKAFGSQIKHAVSLDEAAVAELSSVGIVVERVKKNA